MIRSWDAGYDAWAFIGCNEGIGWMDSLSGNGLDYGLYVCWMVCVSRPLYSCSCLYSYTYMAGLRCDIDYL